MGKREKFFWASVGDFPIGAWDAGEVASCQRLEKEGFALREGYSNKADPSLAVILPNGEVLEYSDLVKLLDEEGLTKEQKEAISYIKNYRRICPYAPKMVPGFFGLLPI